MHLAVARTAGTGRRGFFQSPDLQTDAGPRDAPVHRVHRRVVTHWSLSTKARILALTGVHKNSNMPQNCANITRIYDIDYTALYAMQGLCNGRVSVVCLSVPSTAAVPCGWFAAELGRGQRLSIDIYWHPSCSCGLRAEVHGSTTTCCRD